jgi:hypothetical protein
MRELEAQDVWDDPVVTEVAPADEFYPAEAYHHDYFRRNPQQAYCQAVVRPKVAGFRARFAHKLRSSREGKRAVTAGPLPFYQAYLTIGSSRGGHYG